MTSDKHREGSPRPAGPGRASPPGRVSCGGARPVELGEELFYPRPDLGTVAEPTPVQTHQADQPVAFVDRHEVVTAPGTRSIDEERFNIRRERGEDRIHRNKT